MVKAKVINLYYLLDCTTSSPESFEPWGHSEHLFERSVYAIVICTEHPERSMAVHSDCPSRSLVQERFHVSWGDGGDLFPALLVRLGECPDSRPWLCGNLFGGLEQLRDQ